jgi:hypothetical protein
VDVYVHLRTALLARSVLGEVLSLIELPLCYTYFVLWKKGVWASQAKTLHGLQSLARDCDSPLPTAYLPQRSEAALVALAGRLVNGQVSPCSSSASIIDSNAD